MDGWLTVIAVLLAVLLLRRPVTINNNVSPHAEAHAESPRGSAASSRSIPILPFLLAGGAIVAVIAVSGNSAASVKAISEVSQAALIEQAAVSTAGLQAQMQLARDAAHYAASAPALVASPQTASITDALSTIANVLTIAVMSLSTVIAVLWMRRHRAHRIAVAPDSVFGHAEKVKANRN